MQNKYMKVSRGFLMLCMVAIVALAANMTDAFGKETKSPAEKSSAKTATAKSPTGPVDLNTADQEALESLPGIGAATAREIIKARPFKDADDLGRVKGMSKGKIEKLKGMVTVSQPTGAQPSARSIPAAPAQASPAAQKPAKVRSTAPKTHSGIESKSARLAPGEKVNINTASAEALEALPGIGPVKAQAIIEGRPYNTPEDIMKVKGIKQGTYNKIKDQITTR